MSWRRARDGLLLVVVLATVLLMPPVLPFFDRAGTLLGMPVIVVYVFGVWLAVIALTGLASRHLPRVPPDGDRGDQVAGDRAEKG